MDIRYTTQPSAIETNQRMAREIEDLLELLVDLALAALPAAETTTTINHDTE